MTTTNSIGVKAVGCRREWRDIPTSGRIKANEGAVRPMNQVIESGDPRDRTVNLRLLGGRDRFQRKFRLLRFLSTVPGLGVGSTGAAQPAPEFKDHELQAFPGRESRSRRKPNIVRCQKLVASSEKSPSIPGDTKSMELSRGSSGPTSSTKSRPIIKTSSGSTAGR